MIARLRQQLTRKDFERISTQADWRCKGVGCAASASRNGSGKARLGLIAGKKTLPLAVSRNRFKRIAREVFRQHEEQLRGLDVIISARVHASGMQRYELRISLQQLVARLAGCTASSSP